MPFTARLCLTVLFLLFFVAHAQLAVERGGSFLLQQFRPILDQRQRRGGFFLYGLGRQDTLAVSGNVVQISRNKAEPDVQGTGRAYFDLCALERNLDRHQHAIRRRIEDLPSVRSPARNATLTR